MQHSSSAIRIVRVPERQEAGNTKPNVLVRLSQNAIFNLFRTGSGWIVVVFLPPLFVRVLDKPTYGVWLLLLQLAAYITVVDSGIQVAIARFVARAIELEDHKYLARLLSSSGVIMVAASLLTLLSSVLVAWQLPHVFSKIPDTIAPAARQALLIIGTSIALTLPFSVVAGFFVGLQRYEIPALATTAGKYVGALGIAWAAYHHQGLAIMAVWVALGNIVQCLVYIWFWRRADKHNLLHHSYAERAVIHEFLFFCSVMFVSQFSSILVTGMDLPIVAAFDFQSSGYYGIAATVSNLLIVPHSAIVSTLIPVAAGYSTANDPQRLGQVLLKTTRFATALLCLILLPLMLTMPLLLRLWVGSDYATHVLAYGQILIIAQFIRLTMLPYAMIGYAAGQQQRMLVSAVAEGSVNLLSSLVLVRLIGAGGVALGTLAGAIVGVWLHFCISLPRTDCIQISRKRLLWDSIGKPAVLTLPFFACAVLVTKVHVPLIEILLAFMVDVALFCLFWNLIFDSEERRQLMGVLRHFARIPTKLQMG